MRAWTPRLLARLAQRAAQRGAAPVLPDDRGSERLAGGAVPEDQRLALIGDADRRHAIGPAGRLDHRGGACGRLAPNLGGVVLDQPRGGIMLLDLGRSRAEAFAVGREEHRAGGGGALVDDQQQFAHGRGLSQAPPR